MIPASLQSVQKYLDKRILSIFVLGIASGLPWLLIGSALTIWLKDSGVKRADIGFAGLIFVVYAINFFWSPLIDRVKLPVLSKWLHRRKSWICVCQFAIVLLCFSLSFLSPQLQLVSVILVALAIAVSSATQDIAIDAYRIDSFSTEESDMISTGAAAATSGWWTGYAGLGFVPLYLSDVGWSWQSIYQLLAIIVMCIGLLSLVFPAPKYSSEIKTGDTKTKYLSVVASQSFLNKAWILILVLSPILLTIWALSGSIGIPSDIVSSTFYTPSLILIGFVLGISAAAVLTIKIRAHKEAHTYSYSKFDNISATVLESFSEPIYNFFSRNEIRIASQILLFIFLFKLGEAFLGRMSIVFYKEVGYSNTDIATYSKMLTWWVTIISALFAGYVNGKFGLVRGLVVSGIFMACANLMFSWIALVGPSIPLFIAATTIDGIASAWSLVSFVAFISALCNHSFSASQYALLASLGNLGRTTIASLSGFTVDLLHGNWALFFVITALMVIPSLLLLLSLSRNPLFQLEKKRESPKSY